MQPQHESPVEDIVRLWNSCRPPLLHEINACRARLFEAATHQVSIRARHNISYNPMHDNRFLWANQWLDLAAGTIKRIDPAVEACCHMTLSPAPVTHKHLAAADS